MLEIIKRACWEASNTYCIVKNMTFRKSPKVRECLETYFGYPESLLTFSGYNESVADYKWLCFTRCLHTHKKKKKLQRNKKLKKKENAHTDVSSNFCHYLASWLNCSSSFLLVFFSCYSHLQTTVRPVIINDHFYASIMQGSTLQWNYLLAMSVSLIDCMFLEGNNCHTILEFLVSNIVWLVVDAQ